MKFKNIIIAATVLVAVVLLGITVTKSIFPMRYEEVIDRYADKYDLEEELVAGVIFAESKFEPMAHSGKAMGLMQITDETGKWICEKLQMTYSEEMLYVPEVNIEMGCYYLSYLIDHYKNIETALAAYNAGMGNVTKWLSDKKYSVNGIVLSDIPYGETKRYVQRVKKLKDLYEVLY